MARLRPRSQGSDGSGGKAGDGDVLRWCRGVVARAGELEPRLGALADDALAALTGSFRERLGRGEPVDDLLPEAFAVVREAAGRTLGQRHFDVQLMGGAAAHRGMVAEMRTGEGKTLTATLTAYLHALAGAGVHVLTANDYLAARDAEWMGPVYRSLGLSVGLVRPEQDPERAARRAEYNADVTYGAWEEFGYDYIRDNLAWSRGEQVQRGHHCAIVDEADLILIDEMRTPLLIAGRAEQGKSRHAALAALVAGLEPGLHYEADDRARTVSLTEDGAQAVEAYFGVASLYEEANLPLIHDVRAALRAKELFRRDRDYLVSGGEAVIIDQASGRPVPGRRYAEGVHEAIEARENLEVRPGRGTLGIVPMWDYLGLYKRLAALTGAASDDAQTYRQAYQLDVVTIPTNRPMIRIDHPDVFYRTRLSKLAALADEASARRAAGQPVLIGSASIEECQEISALLTARGVSHELLTARNHDQEARVIAAAGLPGAVTVAAKMAGRGVDIVLGGADGARREQVAQAGGLCVLGTERPAKRRLETLLRGRAGRQGDPGEAKFFVSVEDELVMAMGVKQASFASRHLPEGERFPLVSGRVSVAQARSAAHEAAWLAQLREYDRVVTDQRRLIYAERAPAVSGSDLGDGVRNLIDEVVRAQVTGAHGENLRAGRLWPALLDLYPASIAPPPSQRGNEQIHRAMLPRIADQAAADARRAYDRRESELGVEVIRDLERRVILAGLDQGWREHVEAMGELFNSIFVRAKGAAGLAEYRREGTSAFNRMREAVNRDIVKTLFHIRIEPLDPGTPG